MDHVLLPKNIYVHNININKNLIAFTNGFFVGKFN